MKLLRGRLVLAVVSAALALMAAAIARADDEPSEAPSPTALPSVEALTKRVRPSVVVVTSASRDGRSDALGSGFIISPDGLVATNLHVIGEGRSLRVQLADGRSFEPTAVFASDRQLDLAIVKIDAKDLPSLELGDSDSLRQGQNVVALGSPRGLKNSVVAGVVSSVREVEGRPMIQVAIPIETGNSGGPLVDLEGRVHGILTMKSVVTPNLGFAVTINSLKPLVAKPNSVPMSRWLTIGALDPAQWKPLFGARWRQRAGRIAVEGEGQGFGGRSLCLYQPPPPNDSWEAAVTVQLADESGAAGLAFCSDGEHRHYGFYPTGGRLRFTRFDGPDLLSWTILFDQPDAHYLSGGWNTLRVRWQQGKITASVNDHQVVELTDHQLAPGQVGLVKFRDTKAQFKNFKLAAELPPMSVPATDAERIAGLLAGSQGASPIDPKLIEVLAASGPRASTVARDRAAELTRQAQRLRELADAVHAERVVTALSAVLARGEAQTELFRAGLLVAQLDNEELDVDAYCDELARLERELAGRLSPNSGEADKLELLRKFLFEEHGFHGSRHDYYSRANSYLNEVLDDREGLPITLSIIYLELARSIGLHVEGIGLPGHFVVAHLARDGTTQLIDVFDSAKTLSRDEVTAKLKQTLGHEPDQDVFAPITKRAIITRMLHNLLSVSDSDPKALNRYLNAILGVDPESAQHRWLRAIVRYRLRERAAALTDVEWLLARRPPGVDVGRLLELERAVQQLP
jgi:serine protease Do